VIALLTKNNTTAYFATQVLLPAPAKAATASLAVALSSKAPAWRVVKSVPPVRKGGAFTAVVATGRTSGWAFDGSESLFEPQAWQWRGGSWTREPFPGRNDEEVDAAAATSPDDVWAFTNGYRAPNSVHTPSCSEAAVILQYS
jgi:hypothetical protein